MDFILPESFKGPACYFSMQALKECKHNFLSERHIEMVYATLVAWGMHRSGRGGAKMPDYQDFEKSILDNQKVLRKLGNKKIECLSRKEFDDVLKDLGYLCFDESGICASKTKSKVVSASKTLAHFLPNLVPPIDREYTARYFNYNKGNFTGEREEELLENVMRTLFSLYQDYFLVTCAKRYININYNTTISLPKLFDNLIVEAVTKKNLPKTCNFCTLREKKIFRGINFHSPDLFLNINQLKTTLYLKLPLYILKNRTFLTLAAVGNRLRRHRHRNARLCCCGRTRACEVRPRVHELGA